MVTVIKGDAVTLVLNSENSAIAHGCNVYCKMRKGIAKTISEKVPLAASVDNSTSNLGRSKIGTFSMCPIDTSKNNWVYNLYTQYTYWDEKDMLEYGAVLLSLTRCLRDASSKGVTKVFIPRIGSGLARGCKEKLFELFKIASDDVPEVTLFVVDFEQH